MKDHIFPIFRIIDTIDTIGGTHYSKFFYIALVCKSYIKNIISNNDRSPDVQKVEDYLDYYINNELKGFNFDNIDVLLDVFERYNMVKEDYPILLSELLERDRHNLLESAAPLSSFVSTILNLEDGDTFTDFGSGQGLMSFYTYLYNKDKAINYNGFEISNEDNLKAKAIMLLTNQNYDFVNKNIFELESNILDSNKNFIFPPLNDIRLLRDYRNLDNNIRTYVSSKDPTNYFIGRIEKELKRKEYSKNSNAWDYINKVISLLSDNATLVAFVPQGVLFREIDKDIRREFALKNIIKEIIYLPAKAIPITCSKFAIIVFGKNDKGLTKLVDTSKYLEDLDIPNLLREERVKKFTDKYLSDISSNNQEHIKNVDLKDITTVDYSFDFNALTISDVLDTTYNAYPLESFAELRAGVVKTERNFDISKTPTNYQILTSLNISNGLVDYDSLSYINDGERYINYECQNGDLIITSKSSNIKMTVINKPNNNHIIVTGSMLIVRCKDNLDPYYLEAFLESETGSRLLKSIQKGEVIMTISLSSLKTLPIVYKNIQEQSVIAENYKNLLNDYQTLIKEEKEVLNHIKDLTNSIK